MTSTKYLFTGLAKGTPKDGDDEKLPVPEEWTQGSGRRDGSELLKSTTVEAKRDLTLWVSVGCLKETVTTTSSW